MAIWPSFFLFYNPCSLDVFKMGIKMWPPSLKLSLNLQFSNSNSEAQIKIRLLNTLLQWAVARHREELLLGGGDRADPGRSLLRQDERAALAHERAAELPLRQRERAKAHQVRRILQRSPLLPERRPPPGMQFNSTDKINGEPFWKIFWTDFGSLNGR